MARKLLITFILILPVLVCNGQKSRVISVFQLIESGDYEQAKEAVELAIWNDRTSRWPRTYYAKGLLCQTAYEVGVKKNEPKKTRLYPDQLYVAYASYEKAMELDKRERIHSEVAVQYYRLSNEFQRLANDHYKKKEYAEALNAFEHALLIGKSPLLEVAPDTGLIYNTAIAAYESGNWNKATGYLEGLNAHNYSPEVALLLYHSHLENGDSTMANQVLMDGFERYNSNEDIVLRLVEVFIGQDQQDSAIVLLDSAAARKPANHIFPWTRGLIHQNAGNYQEAIDSYTRAIALEPGEVEIYYNLGICYYNMGVEINETARTISNRSRYTEARNEARERFAESVKWLEKAHEIEPGDQKTISRLYQLYYHLQMDEKRKTLELMIQQSGRQMPGHLPR